MTYATDIYRVAAMLIEQHGSKAAAEAIAHAKAMQSQGYRTGEWTWIRIAAAAEELQRDRAPDQRLN